MIKVRSGHHGQCEPRSGQRGSASSRIGQRASGAGGRLTTPDRESLWELALRKPQGLFGVPADLAVRGAASLVVGWWGSTLGTETRSYADERTLGPMHEPAVVCMVIRSKHGVERTR